MDDITSSRISLARVPQIRAFKILSTIQTKVLQRLDRWLTLAVMALWMFVIAIGLSRWSVWIELASHFVWQAIVGGLALLGLCGWRRRWTLVALGVAPWVYLIVLFQPWNLWWGQPTQQFSSTQSKSAQPSSIVDSSIVASSIESSRRVTVMSWNVLCVNEDLDEIRSVIGSHPVDVLVLVEVRPNLFQQIPELEAWYKFRMAFPSWGGNGIAVLTNREDIRMQRVDLGGRVMPSIVATVGAQELSILGMHTWSPFPPQRAIARDHQLEHLRAWVQQQSEPICVVGDLNITPWAPAFQSMLHAGLVDSRSLGFGNSASWPAWLGPMGIPIDHALSYGGCSIVRRQLGPMVYGSDHRPVLVEIAY